MYKPSLPIVLFEAYINVVLKVKLVADEGFEPPARFCPAPAYETGEMTNFSNPRCGCGGRIRTVYDDFQVSTEYEIRTHFTM